MSFEEIRPYFFAYSPILIMAVMYIVFHLAIIRPQKAEKARRDDMLRKLHKGNKVKTVGGIYGEITEIDKNILSLRIADKVVIKVARGAIGANLSQGKTVKEQPGASEDLMAVQMAEEKEP